MTRIRDVLLKSLVSEVGKARDILSVPSALAPPQCHAARKHLKRARSLLRLVRPHLKSAEFDRENRALRDVARMLSPLRDAQVGKRTVEKVRELARRSGERELLRSLENLREVPAVHQPSRAERQALERTLIRAMEHARSFQIPDKRWKVIEQGLRKTYRDGQTTFRTARRTCEDGAVHEWRKQEKHLRHQLEALEAYWTPRMKPQMKCVARLSDLLGDDQDLAVIRERLEDKLPPTARVPFKRIVKRAQKKLRQDAWALGKDLYESGDRRFAKDVRSRLHDL